MSRFVIQQHRQADQVHWDLMLETADRLATWQVPAHPRDWLAKELLCERIVDHRLAYLSYEGPLSRDRGQVRIADRGTYTAQNIDENYWRIILRGDTIAAVVELTHGQGTQWTLRSSPCSDEA